MPRPRPTAKIETPRTTLQEILRSTALPAFICDSALNILDTNAAGAALLSPIQHSVSAGDNIARFIFLDPLAHDYFMDYKETSTHCAAMLRMESARNPDGVPLTRLIDGLLESSELFHQR